MKKLFSIFISVLLILSLNCCADKNKVNEQPIASQTDNPLNEKEDDQESITTDTDMEVTPDQITKDEPVTEDIKLVNIVDLTIENQLVTASALEQFYEDDNFIYYFPSIKSENIECEFSNGEKMNINVALEKNMVTISDLDIYGISYWTKDKK